MLLLDPEIAALAAYSNCVGEVGCVAAQARLPVVCADDLFDDSRGKALLEGLGGRCR